MSTNDYPQGLIGFTSSFAGHDTQQKFIESKLLYSFAFDFIKQYLINHPNQSLNSLNTEQNKALKKELEDYIRVNKAVYKDYNITEDTLTLKIKSIADFYLDISTNHSHNNKNSNKHTELVSKLIDLAQKDVQNKTNIGLDEFINHLNDSSSLNFTETERNALKLAVSHEYDELEKSIKDQQNPLATKVLKAAGNFIKSVAAVALLIVGCVANTIGFLNDKPNNLFNELGSNLFDLATNIFDSTTGSSKRFDKAKTNLTQIFDSLSSPAQVKFNSQSELQSIKTKMSQVSQSLDNDTKDNNVTPKAPPLRTR